MNPCTECDTNWCRAKAEGKDCPSYYYEPPRPHGEWIKDLNGNAHCTNCGLVLDNYIMAVFFNFCPNCGADMREGEAE